jgi:tetratricopeptide (TPR) repeat protein
MEERPPHGIGGWRVTLDNTVRVRRADGTEATPRARKARAMIAYLASKSGRVATRSELIALLWSDRGRDQARASLRQCLFELRAELPGLVAVEGEQVCLATGVGVHPAKVGALHDLDHIDPAFDRWLADHHPNGLPSASAVSERRAPGRSRVGRWVLAAAALATVLVLAGVAAWVLGRRPATPSGVRVVAILPWSVTPADVGLRSVADRIVTSMNTGMPTGRLAVHVMDSASLVRARRSGAEWIVSGEVLSNSRPTALTVRVQTPAGVLLWSKRLEARDGAAPAADRLANWTSFVIGCAVRGPRGVRRPDDVTALMMDACGKIYSGAPESSSEDLTVAARRFIAAAPRDAYAHGILATDLALNADALPPDLQAAERREAEAEAKRALALDPTTGEAYLALGRLALDRREFATAERLYLRGLAVEPDHPSLPNFVSHLLSSVGRNEEAVVFARRSMASDPTSPVKIVTVSALLARDGQPRAALALLDDAEARRGRDPGLSCERVAVLLRSDPAAARDAIARAAEVPGCLEPARQAQLVRETYAIQHPRGPEATALLRELEVGGESQPREVARTVEALAGLGRTEAALALAQRHLLETSVLFEPATRGLLLSPRFPDIARRQGLWRYWEETGHWPDICRDPALPWRCSGSRQ